MVFFAVLFCTSVLLTHVVNGNTGSELFGGDGVDVISEINTLRQLLNQESLITRELGKQIMEQQSLIMKLQDENARNEQEDKFIADEVAALRRNLSLYKSESDVIAKSQELTSSDVTNLASAVKNKMSGSVFTRWGRTSCPNTSELVYAGNLF